MLFHITHVHTPETCPGKDPEKVRDTFGKMLTNAEEIGVKMVGVWADGPSHTIFMVIETDTAEKIFDFILPGLTIGTAEVKPVQDAMALLKRYGVE